MAIPMELGASHTLEPGDPRRGVPPGMATGGHRVLFLPCAPEHPEAQPGREGNQGMSMDTRRW